MIKGSGPEPESVTIGYPSLLPREKRIDDPAPSWQIIQPPDDSETGEPRRPMILCSAGKNLLLIEPESLKDPQNINVTLFHSYHNDYDGSSPMARISISLDNETGLLTPDIKETRINTGKLITQNGNLQTIEAVSGKQSLHALKARRKELTYPIKMIDQIARIEPQSTLPAHIYNIVSESISAVRELDASIHEEESLYHGHLLTQRQKRADVRATLAQAKAVAEELAQSEKPEEALITLTEDPGEEPSIFETAEPPFDNLLDKFELEHPHKFSKEGRLASDVIEAIEEDREKNGYSKSTHIILRNHAEEKFPTIILTQPYIKNNIYRFSVLTRFGPAYIEFEKDDPGLLEFSEMLMENPGQIITSDLGIQAGSTDLDLTASRFDPERQDMCRTTLNHVLQSTSENIEPGSSNTANTAIWSLLIGRLERKINELFEKDRTEYT